MVKNDQKTSEKKILLHTCCGPCATYCVKSVRDKGFEKVFLFYYNPNIHPFKEYERRQEGVEKLVEIEDLRVIYSDSYEVEKFFRGAVFREDERCMFCYAQRLRRSAAVARKGKFPFFSTTLLISPYQDHALIRDLGKAAGEEYGVNFYYEDFRDGFSDSVALSNEMELYRQQYCGCIYSEKERYYSPEGDDE